MEKDKYRVIKISKEALFEFIYEKFIEEQQCYLEVEPCDVINNFYLDLQSGEFIFMASKGEDENGNIIPFPKEIDISKLLRNMEDTTTSMFKDNRYKEYTVEELLKIQERETRA